MSKAWKGGSTRRWRRLRAALLLANQLPPPEGNGGLCRLAIPRVCTGRATQVHHVLGKGVSGDDPRYLVCVCGPCNLHVGEPAANPDPPVRPLTQW